MTQCPLLLLLLNSATCDVDNDDTGKTFTRQKISMK